MPPYRFSKTIFSALNGKLVSALRKARQRAHLTQVQAAEKLGCRQTFLSKIEYGERRVDVVEFLVICRAYDASPAKIIQSLVGDVSDADARRTGGKLNNRNRT